MGALIVLVIAGAVVTYAVLASSWERQAQAALARVKASGAPATWQQAIPPRVPDLQNAAIPYGWAFEALKMEPKPPPRPRPKYPPYPPPGPTQGPGPRDMVRKYLGAKTPQERAALAGAARKVLADNAEALAYAWQAAARPRLRFNRNYDVTPMAVEYPEFAKLKDLARLACAQALMRADAGDLGGALRAWSLNVEIAKQLASETSLFGQLTRYAILALGEDALQKIVKAGRPNPAQCDQLAHGLAALDLNGPFIKSLEFERAAMLETLEETYRHHSVVSSDVPVRPLGAFAGLDRAAMLRLWEKEIALARKPYRETVGQFDNLDRDVPRYALVTYVMSPLYGRAVAARDRAGALVGVMRAGLELEAYRGRFGRYPGSLSELAAALKSRPAEDPFSGKPLVYRRIGKGYLLYSIGPDLKDDGGKPVDYGTAKPPARQREGDIVWRVAR